VVFNATVVETGARVALGTVDFPPESGLATLRSMLHLDTSPAAAARLSASYPYVTPAAVPAATALPGRSRLHFVDGGYYDNYGVGAAIAFLDSASAVGALPPEVLVVEIRASRSAAPGDPVFAAARASGSTALFQWMAPLLTMVNVRDAAQRARNDAELDLLARALIARGTRLRRVSFEFPGNEVPLSWHLTRRQEAGIGAGWRNRFAGSPETRAVGDYLGVAHNPGGQNGFN
jgi:hypothetical protein